MASAAILILTLCFASYLAFSKRLRNSSDWAATVTPLASIMGSGFLISAPLLANIVGIYSVFFMGGLLVLAYGVGGAIRFNIRNFEPIENAGMGPAQVLALISRIISSVAYCISISYYLQLLAAFSLHFFDVSEPAIANLVTSALLILIAGIGIWKGLGRLEKIERYVVALNLGMVGALICGLVAYNAGALFQGKWSLPDVDNSIDFTDLRILLGLLIVVQGFETSGYLGEAHSQDQRIKTMKYAQLISAVIYLLFIGFSTLLFYPGLGADVTAIIVMTAPVAALLPILLSVAAIGSQFSAAVADTSGAGGLLGDLSKGKLTEKSCYVLILAITLGLTWVSDVNEIISYASRAFAAYYFLQCLVAFRVAREQKKSGAGLYAFLGVVCLAVTVLGLPSE